MVEIPLLDFRGVEWSVEEDREVLLEHGYQRFGGCNQCGACCQRLVLNVICLREEDLERIKRKYPSLRHTGWSSLGFPMFECTALGQNEGTEEKPIRRCTLFGLPERPDFCSDYPSSPFSSLPDTCTYRWVSMEDSLEWTRDYGAKMSCEEVAERPPKRVLR